MYVEDIIFGSSNEDSCKEFGELMSKEFEMLESIVVADGEHIRSYLSYLPGLTDLIGWTGLYVPSWVRQFYATLWIDP